MIGGWSWRFIDCQEFNSDESGAKTPVSVVSNKGSQNGSNEAIHAESRSCTNMRKRAPDLLTQTTHDHDRQHLAGKAPER